MLIRNDKNAETIVKQGVKLALNKEFQLARRTMTKAGIAYQIIDRILYEPHNIRKTDTK